MAVADGNPGKSEGIDLTNFRGTWVISTHSKPEPEPGMQPSHCTITDLLFNVPHGASTNWAFGIFASPDIKYAVNSQASWIHVTSATKQGNGNVFFDVDANPGAPRVGFITVCRQSVEIDQA